VIGFERHRVIQCLGRGAVEQKDCDGHRLPLVSCRHVALLQQCVRRVEHCLIPPLYDSIFCSMYKAEKCLCTPSSAQ
jgi:hypothetical protein